MNSIWKILKGFLLGWGAFSLVAALFLGAWISYGLTLGNRSSDKPASKRDVRFVLNNCKLGDDRIEEVVHSYISSRHITGDHLDAHAIRVTHLDASELVFDNTYGKTSGWYRGDELTGFPKEVVDFVASWLPQLPSEKTEISWFPTIDEIRSPTTYVWIEYVRTHGTRPFSAQVIFARPEDRMIYYFSAKY